MCICITPLEVPLFLGVFYFGGGVGTGEFGCDDALVILETLCNAGSCDHLSKAGGDQ